MRKIFFIFSISISFISLTLNLLILSISSNQKQVLILLISSSGSITSKSLFLSSMTFLSNCVLSKTKYFLHKYCLNLSSLQASSSNNSTSSILCKYFCLCLICSLRLSMQWIYLGSINFSLP